MRRHQKLADIVVEAKILERGNLHPAERFALRATKPGPASRRPGQHPKKTASRLPAAEWRPFHVHPLKDGEEPAHVYLLRNPDLKALKIGVTARARVEEFEADGWEVVRIWNFATGFDAMDVEERVLDRWRNVHRTKASLKRSQLASGYTETTADSPTVVNDAIEFVQQCHDEMTLQSELASDRFWDEEEGWPASPWEDWVSDHRPDRALSVEEVQRMFGRVGAED
ncbi:MAG: hypothetical protein U0Q22_03495 [Acidimicrobiales bacterium]